MSVGKNLSAFGSKLFSGPLGVVQIGFNGYDLGLTTDSASLKPDLDVKDIMYQQKGTKAYDHVITGADWILTCTFGEIMTELLLAIAPYLIGSSGSVGSDSGHIKADMYESLLDTVGAGMKVASVIDQLPSTDIEDILNFYIGIPIINADLLQWGADVQRNIPVEFRIKPKVMTLAESTSVKMSHGYWGDPTAEDVPAIVWPDKEAPEVVSATAVLATSLEVVCNENITEIAGVTIADQVVVKVGNEFVKPISSAYATTKLTLTFASSTFTSGDIMELYVGAETYEDAESNANEAVDGFSVTDSI